LVGREAYEVVGELPSEADSVPEATIAHGEGDVGTAHECPSFHRSRDNCGSLPFRSLQSGAKGIAVVKVEGQIPMLSLTDADPPVCHNSGDDSGHPKQGALGKGEQRCCHVADDSGAGPLIKRAAVAVLKVIEQAIGGRLQLNSYRERDSGVSPTVAGRGTGKQGQACPLGFGRAAEQAFGTRKSFQDEGTKLFLEGCFLEERPLSVDRASERGDTGRHWGEVVQ